MNFFTCKKSRLFSIIDLKKRRLFYVMYRFRNEDLKKWLVAKDRKPLIIRGARQVGKTWLVQHFAQEQQLHLIEVNLEKQPNLASLFVNDVQQTLLNLSATFERTIEPEHCLLFIDEIQ